MEKLCSPDGTTAAKNTTTADMIAGTSGSGGVSDIEIEEQAPIPPLSIKAEVEDLESGEDVDTTIELTSTVVATTDTTGKASASEETDSSESHGHGHGHGHGEIRFNPLVSLLALVSLWGLASYCMARPVEASVTLNRWFNTVIDLFTWFYIAANPVLTFFVVWVAYRFGDIKLGAKDAEPEFSNATYFAMIFSAGVGVGLWHVEPDNYYSNAGYHS